MKFDMKSAKLRVRNFGPIDRGLENGEWIEFPLVTLFCGAQGSGKSTVTKLFSIVSWIEKSVFRDPELQIDDEFFVRSLEWQGVESYLRPDTEIDYEGRYLRLSYREQTLSCECLSDSDDPYLVPKISYMPAERNFASIARNANRVEGLPSSLVDMQVEFEKAKRFFQKGYRLPANGFSFLFDKDAWIVNGTNDGSTRTHLENASSGLQSIVPMLLVSEYLAMNLCQKNDISRMGLFYDPGTAEKRIRRQERVDAILKTQSLTEDQKKSRLEQLFTPGCRFLNIVEEPEQNLYPETQCAVMNRLLAINNENSQNRLVVSTHSPYVHNHLILVAQAAAILLQKQGDRKAIGQISKIIPENACVKGGDIAIYEMDGKGGVLRLKAVGGLPTDENPMNRLLGAFNQKYADLLEIMDEQG